MDDVHVPNAGLRPSAELLTELQKAEGRESCEEPADTSIQETGANTFRIPPTQASLHTKGTILTNERKWKVIHALSTDGENLEIAVSKNGYKNGASLRPR